MDASLPIALSDNPATARQRTYRRRHRARIDALKLERGCADCGYCEYPEALDFDHIGDDKVKSVSELLAYGWDKILAEIAKCEVVCANCHRVRTARRGTSRQNAWRAA